MTSKMKKYDASDDEDGDGVTTGPSHPSLESNSPRTPSDESPPKPETGALNGPPPPPPPPPPPQGGAGTGG
jgi:cytokinesis protein